jgi:hypothetical protein
MFGYPSHSMSSAQSSQKLIVITSGLIAQYVIHYFDLGLVFGGLALLASCGALVAVHFSREEVILDRGKTDHALSGRN